MLRSRRLQPGMQHSNRKTVAMNGKRTHRRQFLKAAIAAGASTALRQAPAIAQGISRVVVVGGGFAGSTCARELKRLDPKLQVTLVEANPTFTACPFSNAVIAGFRELKAQQFTYEAVASDALTLA